MKEDKYEQNVYGRTCSLCELLWQSLGVSQILLASTLVQKAVCVVYSLFDFCLALMDEETEDLHWPSFD